jgi:hypothetical protein
MRTLTADETELDGIAPVYDAQTTPAPRTVELCRALHDEPVARKAQCCGKERAGPSPVVAPCAGALSSALKLKDVTLDDAKVAACIAARSAQLEGCSWVGLLQPPAPDACRDLIVGALDEGARCRSSLACKAGLRCVGASLLDTGRCKRPLPARAPCGGSVDGLAVVVGQTEVDRAHPECEGACIRGRCVDTAPAGAPCFADAECGKGNRCDPVDDAAGAKQCVAGRIAVGEKCKLAGCVEGARCIDGACRKKAKEGEACTSELDCEAGGCVDGTCGMQCREGI